MATVQTIQGDVVIVGSLTVTGTPPSLTRAQLTMESNAPYKIPLESWRVWDAFGTNLPATPASDDLGLVGGTFGTASPTIQSGDLKAAGATTRRARVTFSLPTEYVAGQAITIRAHAGMDTTVSDGTATLDFEVYKSNDEAGIGSDLCATAAQSINSLTDADYDFSITSSGLSPGDTLDIRMSVTVNDAATVTAVIAVVGGVKLLLGVKG
jgi:hypothetical protein